MARLLGVDPGLRYVGLAISDPGQVIARPLKVVDGEVEELSVELQQLLEEYEVELLLVGYPEPLGGGENERTRQVEDFIKEYLEPLAVPYRRVSERYTSKQAQRLAQSREASDQRRDADAAALIVNHFIAKKGEEK